jgi:hypothetical protein
MHEHLDLSEEEAWASTSARAAPHAENGWLGMQSEQEEQVGVLVATMAANAAFHCCSLLPHTKWEGKAAVAALAAAVVAAAALAAVALAAAALAAAACHCFSLLPHMKWAGEAHVPDEEGGPPGAASRG